MEFISIASKIAAGKMKLLFYLSFLVRILTSSNLSAQQIPKWINNDDYPDIGYLEYLPPDYQAGTDYYPVIIFLHGGGEGGYGTPEELEKVMTWGPPSHIRNGHDMCFTVNDREECFIVISPQLMPLLYVWEPYYVDRVIDHVLNGPDAYRADPNRIYLTGLSRGGLGVYQYASSHLNNPNKLAAIAPVAAWSDEYFDGCIIAKRNIPVWAFHGAKDTVVPYSLGVSAFNEIKDCNTPEPEAELIFTTYDDRYHDSWIPAYDQFNLYHTPSVYEWMLKHTRQPGIISGLPGQSADVYTSMVIYPNPARDILYFSFNDQSWMEGTINILSLTGEKVMEVKDIPDKIDISELSEGLYIVQLEFRTDIIATKRLVINYSSGQRGWLEED